MEQGISFWSALLCPHSWHRTIRQRDTDYRNDREEPRISRYRSRARWGLRRDETPRPMAPSADQRLEYPSLRRQQL